MLAALKSSWTETAPSPSANADGTEKQIYRIAVLPGDGIGPEVIGEGIKVLEAVTGCVSGLGFDFKTWSVGAAEYLRSGTPLPAAALDACRDADAVLLGAMGLPEVRWPDGLEMTPQIDLRERLDLFCGLRPVRLYHAGDSPLKSAETKAIDLLLVRENTEGLFSARLARRSPDAAEVTDTLKISRHGAERIIRAAFLEARKRRKHVALVDKANVLPSMVFFREIFDEVAREFPEVDTDRIYVDAAVLYLVREPERFDVIVTENMFGDILSDLAAGLVGGMGMAPSADIGDQCGVFQPAHGTAPDIVGKGMANPIATILSAAMMLDWLASPASLRGAALIHGAVEEVLANPANRTADLGGRLTTVQMGDLVAAQIANANTGET